MVQSIICKLCNNLHCNISNNNNNSIKKPIYIDLILDSGAFSGSYLLGGLFYIKLLERKNIVSVCRISGCSVGSLLGFLYFIDRLDIANQLFTNVKKYFSQNSNLKIIKKIIKKIISNTPDTIIDKLKNKLFVSYYNLNKCKHITLSKFNKKNLYTSLISSCHIPFISDGKILFNNKYIDGIYPYFFKPKKNRSIVFMNLWSYYLFDMLYIKNEINNDARTLEGVIQTHHFFFDMFHKDTICKKSKLCFLYNKMSFIDYCLLHFRIYFFLIFICLFHIVIYYIKFYGFEKDAKFKSVFLHYKWFSSFKCLIRNSISLVVRHFLT